MKRTTGMGRLAAPLVAALAAAVLAACGGGGGGDAALESASARDKAWTQVPALAQKEARADSAGAPAARASKLYIVQLAEEPATAYRGGIAGYAATKPRAGQKIDPTDPAVSRYVGYLAARHDAVLASAGRSSAAKAYSYGYVFNGFAAELTDAQAARLAATAGVLSVSKDDMRSMDTSTTPTFLGLEGSEGVWEKLGATGENVIIGVVDSGIWPEHPSFSDRDSRGKLVYQQIPGWHGRCIPGEAFNASHCNQKLIGARYYNAGFGGNAGIDSDLPFEFNSPRDHNGHGSHTASTAGGNRGVQATGPSALLGKINGIAPRARIAVYKTCWSVPGTAGSCAGSDSIAAIDQAVADGVDVLNYSVSGSRTNFRDPVEIAFLYAADAGVFVAAAAGNNGPSTSTVNHPGPWLTTVAAGTHNRDGQATVTLGNGASYVGAAYTDPVGPLPLVHSVASGLPGADAATLALCYGATDGGGARLDPAKVTGKIVLCERGGNVLVNKAQAVKDAGGLGMVLVNTPTSANTTLAIQHVIPAIHVANSAYAALTAYAATPGATAQISATTVVLTAPAPTTASFSSRGPLQASGSLLKPDLIAPGQDILAAVAPPNNSGRLFDLYSGTSMASPHVAGLAALMKQLHPGWSPMAIKSALMTTASNVIDGPDTNPTVIFRQGAGHVVPMKAADPGLVFDAGFNDWLGFLCGTQLPVSFCTSAGIPVLEPSNLNGASIAAGAMAGSQTVSRTVTNVGDADETYTASVTGLAGMTVAVTPATLSVPKGGKASFSVSFARTSAALNTYVGGQLTLSGDKGHRVRVPMVVRPVALAAPAAVAGTGAAFSYDVTFGYTGSFGAAARGMVPALVQTGAVATDAHQDFQVVIPAGTTYARFSLFDADVSQASDLDLEVYNAAGTLVAGSGSATASEEANLANPAAGTYTVRVIGFAVPSGAASFKLFSWALGSTAADPANMTVAAPASAVQGPGSIGLSFSNLLAGTRYLGSVVYSGVAGLPSPTIVRVDTP